MLDCAAGGRPGGGAAVGRARLQIWIVCVHVSSPDPSTPPAPPPNPAPRCPPGSSEHFRFQKVHVLRPYMYYRPIRSSPGRSHSTTPGGPSSASKGVGDVCGGLAAPKACSRGARRQDSGMEGGGEQAHRPGSDRRRARACFIVGWPPACATQARRLAARLARHSASQYAGAPHPNGGRPHSACACDRPGACLHLQASR